MVLQPRKRLRNFRFVLYPRSLATTWGISFDFSSSGYLDVSIPPGTSLLPIDSAGSTRRLNLVGLPIRTSTGQRLCAPHRGLSQLITSFIGFLCQGIHRLPLPSSFNGLNILDCTFAVSAKVSTDAIFLKKIELITLCSSQGTRGRTLETGY